MEEADLVDVVGLMVVSLLLGRMVVVDSGGGGDVAEGPGIAMVTTTPVMSVYVIVWHTSHSPGG